MDKGLILLILSRSLSDVFPILRILSIMTEVVKNYLSRYFEPSLNESLIRKRSLEQAKKYQAFYEYLDLDRERLLRQKQQTSGLRNIGNTCYFNVFLQLLYHVNSFRDMFLQGSLRAEKGQRSTLPCELQNLFGQMLFSKFAYCDPSEAFLTLNRSNPDKINLGDEYDLNEYFSITLDTIEKCISKQPSLEGRDKVIEKVFYGKLNQHFDDGKVVSTSSVKFGVINLDVKQGSLEQAFETFKNYSIDGYKSSIGNSVSAKVRSEITTFPELMTFYVNRVELKEGKLTKNNTKFTYPEVLQFNKDKCEYKLNKDCEDLEKKIARVQQIIDEKEYSKLLKSLKETQQFLDRQEFDDIGDLSLGIKELNYNFGIFGGDSAHDDTKRRLRYYIQKLEKQQELLVTTLLNLKQQKRKLSEKTMTTQYNLFALMIHQGSAVSGHYYIYIYNENQRKWRKYNDRFVSQVTAEQVHKVALGDSNANTNVSCLIYKASEFKCDPFIKPPVSASLKSSVAKQDEFVAQNINRVRIERMLRNCSDIAKEETEYFVEGFEQDPLICMSYFSNPVYYWIGAKEIKLAQFSRLIEMIEEPSFIHQAITSQLPPVQDVAIPHMNGAEVPNQYQTISETIKMAIDEESRQNITQSLLYLVTKRHIASKVPILRDLYDQIIIIFLFKACFYIDLKMQTNQDPNELFELIKFVKSSLTNSILTMQIDENLRYSMGGQYNDKVKKISLSDSIFKGAKPADHINIERALFSRFKIWAEFYRQVQNRKVLVKQDDRVKEEIVQFVNYIK